MAEGQVRSFVSLIALVSLMIGMGAMLLGIFEESSDKNKVVAEEFIIPASIGNVFAVIFLIYLTATSLTRSTFYKLIVIIVLLGGLMGEVYLTMLEAQMPLEIATYAVIALNFLIRMFYVLEYVQDSWMALSWTVPTMAAVKAQVTSTATTASDAATEFKSKWKSILTDARTRNPNIDSRTEGKGWSIVDAAVKAGTFTKDKLREALDQVKNADGSAITGVTIGGKKRR